MNKDRRAIAWANFKQSARTIKIEVLIHTDVTPAEIKRRLIALGEAAKGSSHFDAVMVRKPVDVPVEQESSVWGEMYDMITDKRS